MRRVRDVLTCAPLDGDMWLRLAVLAQSLHVDPDTVNRYLDWSYRTTPHEHWIQRRRDIFFPDDGEN